MQGERERPLLRTIAKYAKSGGKKGQDGEEGAVTALASAGMQARSIPPAVVDHFIGATTYYGSVFQGTHGTLKQTRWSDRACARCCGRHQGYRETGTHREGATCS